MSKLSDIIDAATGETVSIASLLRQVKVLGARTDTQVLSDWVDKELSGYPLNSELPAYRGPFETKVVSEWSGPFNSMIKNAPLAPLAFPETMREVGAFEVDFRESVSELERLAQNEGTLCYHWGTDAIALLNGMMQQGELPELRSMAPMHGLVSAHRVVSAALITSVLDQVRTRILGLALDIEKVAPQAGEPGAELTNPQAVQHIVNTYIYGDGNTVAVNSPDTIQVANVAAGDLNGLLSAAKSFGLSEQDTDELRRALEGDAADEEPHTAGIGTRVTQFMGKLAMGGLTIAGETSTQEGTKILGSLVRNYLGLPP